MVFWQQRKCECMDGRCQHIHHKTAGTYNVHVYGVVNGQQINLGQTTFEVSNPKGKTEVRNYNSVKGSFDVIVKNISSKSGFSQYRFRYGISRIKVI